MPPVFWASAKVPALVPNFSDEYWWCDCLFEDDYVASQHVPWILKVYFNLLHSPAKLAGFFYSGHPALHTASGQSHWRSAVHCQTVGNANSGFALRANASRCSKNSRIAVFHSFSCRRRTSWTMWVKFVPDEFTRAILALALSGQLKLFKIAPGDFVCLMRRNTYLIRFW